MKNSTVLMIAGVTLVILSSVYPSHYDTCYLAGAMYICSAFIIKGDV